MPLKPNADRRVCVVMSVVGLVWAAGVAVGQGAAPEPAPMTGEARRAAEENEQMLKDFIHFVRINRADVAAGTGTKLLEKKLKPVEFVELVERSGEQARFEDTVARAMRSPQTEPTAAALLRLFEAGKLERVRDPKEIARHIEMLKGNQRGRMIARERLIAAREYATPQLLEALMKMDYEVRAEVERVLIAMGQQAVTPLASAVGQLDPASQETVVNILGQIGSRTALPYLYDLMDSTQLSGVRTACDTAARRIGVDASRPTAADLYAQLGEQYYEARTELTSFPNEEHQLLWAYNPASGLNMTAVRSEVYHEAMAMRMAERSLALRGEGNRQAMSLWLASNFSRELETPKGYDNPAYGKDRREAMYYAVAAGPSLSQEVLGRALARRDSRLARQAIAAIEQTASGPALFASTGDAPGSPRPLVDALTFPNRRVQYDAALAIARANPTQTFSGSERVVPALAGAIRDAGSRFAVVVTDNRELGDGIRKTLEGGGYTVLPVSGGLGELAGPIAEAPGIDLVVSNLSAERTGDLVKEVRSSARMSATPILAITSPQGAIDLSRQFARDAAVAVRPSGISQEQISAAAGQLVEAATGGPIGGDEAKAYAASSLAALRDLAISNSTVLPVGDAALPLIASLTDGKGPPRLAVADVLARVNQKRAQVALCDAAMAASSRERVDLLARTAESVRRFGNQLEQRQVDRVVELTRTATGAEATAAAALLGSMNLPASGLLPLILNTK